MTVSAEVTEAFQYADDVVGGRIAVCAYVRLACERFLVDVQEAVDGISPWEFNPELTARPIILTELLPSIKGPLAGQPIRLMGWQKFAIVNLFGFVERGTTTRRFRQGVTVLHGSEEQAQQPQPCLISGDADIIWASQRQHTVQDTDSDGDLGRPAWVRARAQGSADHPFVAADRRLSTSPSVVSGRFLPGHAPVLGDKLQMAVALGGLVAAVSLSTASERGGMMTAAAG